MISVFETLKQLEFVDRKGVNISLIDSLSKRDIYGVVDLLLHQTETVCADIAQNTFTHSASQSIAGREKCSFLPHRLFQLDEIARFAAMYSDCVYVENFFLDYEHFNSRNVTDLRESLHDDISMLTAMKPLLEAGHLRFYTPEMHSCLSCFEAVFGDVTQRRIKNGYKRLSKEYFENTTVSLIEYSKRVCKFGLHGPKPFYEHPMVMISPGTKGRPREIVGAKPRVLQKLKDDGEVQLSRTVAKELGLHRKFAGTVANSASFGILSSRILKTSFLTDNPLDISFLQAISNSPEIDARNQIAFKHLTSIVPFMDDVSMADILRLRKREEEAFIAYRRALNEAIDEFKSGSSPFTEKQARELYSDKIAPRLAALDKSVKVAKRDLVKKGARSIAAVVGVISFGLYSGFIPTEFAELIKAVGFTKIGIDLVEKIVPTGEALTNAKKDDLYFLWQAKKLAN